MTIRAVLFDFAGVITSSPWAALTDAGGGNLELLIGSYEQDTDHPWHRVERGELAIMEWAAEVAELGKAQGIEVDFAPLQSLLGDMTLHEPVIERVRRLREEGFLLALVTNNVREGSATWRAMVPVDDLFDVVIDSSDVGVRKPNPAIYRLALERLGGVAPEEAVFIDDAPGNVLGAQAVGLHGILFEDPDQALAALDAVLAAG